MGLHSEGKYPRGEGALRAGAWPWLGGSKVGVGLGAWPWLGGNKVGVSPQLNPRFPMGSPRLVGVRGNYTAILSLL